MFEHILFSHNDVETRILIYEGLTNLGYKVTTAPTHKEILEILKKERPDYIILDHTISDVEAEIILEKVKLIDENIKVVILSALLNDTPQGVLNSILLILKGNGHSAEHEKNRNIQIKARILVVDDDNECAELIKKYLSRRGYEVENASSGEEAILKINIARPDVVLLDIYMPGADGMLILKNIKEIDKNIIVIMATGAEDERLTGTALKLGASGYLIKPFSLEKLEAIILNEILHHCHL